MAAYAFSTVSGSTTSGTYSTTYASSRASVVSSELDLASQLSRIDLSSGLEEDEEKLKKIERTKRLVKEFCDGDGDLGAVVERWLSELGVGWVLGLRDDASAGASLLLRGQRNLTEIWIRALNEITGSTVAFSKLIQDVLVLETVQLLFQETVLKMLPFLDALLLAAVDLPDAGTDTADSTIGEEKLQTLLDVIHAVSSASTDTTLCFEYSGFKVEMEIRQRTNKLLRLLSAKVQRLNEAVWNTMEEIRTSILNDDDSEWGIQTPHGSSEICKVTRSLVTYTKSVDKNYSLLDYIVCRAAELGNYYYVPEQDKTHPLSTIMKEMFSSVQLKLAKRSESFPDQSLRLIFLVNNTHFIWQQLHPGSRFIEFRMAIEALNAKVEDYILKYLQVSWEPALSCLYNHRPRWFRKNSALPKFELEFQKTYTAQKLWKVPDSGLRTRLRRAITEKIVSGFTKYLEDNNVTNPGVTPQEREEMLLELFEG